MANRIVDAIAVTIGWFLVIIAFYLQERDVTFVWLWGTGCAEWPFSV